LRLLFLLPHVPGLQAPAGGARSTAHLLAGLSVRHDVAVLCLRRPHDPPTDATVRQSCVVLEEIEAPAAPNRSRVSRGALRAAGALRRPGWVRRTDVAAYRARVRSLAREWRPDIVHIGYHVMGQYARELRACPALRVLTEHEPGVTVAHDVQNDSRGLARVRARLEIGAWVRYEGG